MDDLFSDVQWLDVNERRKTFCKVCENGNVKGFLLNLSRMKKKKKYTQGFKQCQDSLCPHGNQQEY